MWEVFSWMAYDYSTWTEAFNWDVAAVPAGPHGQLVAQANGDTFTIPKSSKHPDQAWEVAKWLMAARDHGPPGQELRLHPGPQVAGEPAGWTA